MFLLRNADGEIEHVTDILSRSERRCKPPQSPALVYSCALHDKYRHRHRDYYITRVPVRAMRSQKCEDSQYVCSEPLFGVGIVIAYWSDNTIMVVKPVGL